MKRILLLSYAITLALVTPVVLHAQILVDKSPPDNVNAYFSTTSFPQFVAQPFTLSSSATIAGFNFWGVYSAGGSPSPFVVNFFSNVGGQPGALLSTSALTLTGTATGGMVAAFPLFRFQSALTPFAVSAGNYWVSVYDTRSSDSFAWATSAQTGTFDFSTTSPNGPWLSTNGTLAFQVLGPAAVPEGGASSVMLLCLAFASLVALRRMKTGQGIQA